MYKVIEFNTEEKYIKDFLELPKKMYSNKEYTQNYSLEKEILEETHVLNKYFNQKKYIVYKDEEAVARCIITLYDNSKVAYIGYFESVNDSECVKQLFDKVEQDLKDLNNSNDLKQLKIIEIVGPIDSSFWNKYRLKINNFGEKPYFGEPYNKEYYQKLFEENGYSVFKTWSSNLYKNSNLFSKEERNLYKPRLDRAKSLGYEIKNPNKKDFNDFLEAVYNLLMETYKDFYSFHFITLEDFKKLFSSFYYIADYKMIDIAYLKNEPVAFSIVVPDLENETYKSLNVFRKIKIFSRKIRAKRYISLYMAVKKDHLGLSRALAQVTLNKVDKKKSKLVGALIEKGKVTGGIWSDYIEKKSDYVLLKKQLE